jgi:translocation and assembly module TamA
MKWLLTCALLTGLPALLHAQGQDPSPPAPVVAPAAAPTQAAFILEIDAPDEIRTLLAQHLELQRYRELSDLNDGELARLLTAARQNAQALVATLGYFAPDIRIEQQAAASGAAPRVVKLTVAPGEPTLIGEVHVEFSGPIANDPAALTQRQQIEANWSLRAGMRFTQGGWARAKQQALRQLMTQRYPSGQLGVSLADIDPASHSARLSVTLDSGPPYRLGDLVISGLQRQDAELVTRLARLTPGADYDQAQLVQAQQRLVDSGYFTSAFVSLDTSGAPSAAPVRVQLNEASLKKLVLGVGFSTDSGPRLSAEHTHLKLPGIGWRAASKLLLDRDTQAIGTELTAPLDAANWRWVTSVLLQSQQLGSFRVDSQRLRGGRSQNGERIDRNYYLQYDRADTAASDGTALVVAEALTANYGFTVRNFDSLPFPSSGWGLAVELGAGTTLGSQQDPFGRVLARWLDYQALGRSNDSATPDQRAGRIALRGEAGAVIAKEGVALPSTQLFLTGGDSSVRGYSLNELGVTLPNGQITAGRYLAVGSVEWQRPITVNGRLTDWEGTVFVDAGAVADQPADLHPKVGVGVGARWKSPVGPLEIDLAYGVDVQRFRLHMSVGFTF